MKFKFKTYDYLAHVWEFAEAFSGKFHIRYGLTKMAKDWAWNYKVWHIDPQTGFRSEVAYGEGFEYSKRNGKAAIMEALTQDMERFQMSNA